MAGLPLSATYSIVTEEEVPLSVVFPLVLLVVTCPMTVSVSRGVAVAEIVTVPLTLMDASVLNNEGVTLQVTKAGGIVVPFALAIACRVPPGCAIAGVTDTVRPLLLLIVPVMMSIGTVVLCPPDVAVTVAVLPLALGIGVTVTVAALVVDEQPVLLSEMRAQLVSLLVHVGETLEVLPLTSTPLADSCRVPPPLELRTAVDGVTLIEASEFGETKKPLQPTSMNAVTVKPMNAKTAVPVRDIAPPEHTFSS